ncbi:MAG: hypothetical protein R2856_21025 [Caldilineaceae bacterium]
MRCIVDLIPEQWLGGETIFEDVAAHRQGYVEYLSLRRDAADTFLQEAARARAAL